MGPVQSHFTHHLTQTPCSTTYVYTRSNGLGAVESRHTIASPKEGVRSMITFSDGRGFAITVTCRGCIANNFADCDNATGPQDGFNRGDYSHLIVPWVCKCGAGCGRTR
jgi:hypothetical protein